MWWISLPHSAIETNIPILKDEINEHCKNASVSVKWEDLMQPISRRLKLCFAKGEMEVWKAIYLCACHVLVLSL